MAVEELLFSAISDNGTNILTMNDVGENGRKHYAASVGVTTQAPSITGKLKTCLHDIMELPKPGLVFHKSIKPDGVEKFHVDVHIPPVIYRSKSS